MSTDCNAIQKAEVTRYNHVSFYVCVSKRVLVSCTKDNRHTHALLHVHSRPEKKRSKSLMYLGRFYYLCTAGNMNKYSISAYNLLTWE